MANYTNYCCMSHNNCFHNFVSIKFVHSFHALHAFNRYVDELLYWSGRRMLLDEYLQGDLSPNRLPPTWVSKSKFVFQSDDGSLAVYETTDNSVKTLVTNHTLVSSSSSSSCCYCCCRIILVCMVLDCVSFCNYSCFSPLSLFLFSFRVQRQLNIKGYQCSTNLEFVLFKHNVKTVSIQVVLHHFFFVHNFHFYFSFGSVGVFQGFFRFVSCDVVKLSNSNQIKMLCWKSVDSTRNTRMSQQLCAFQTSIWKSLSALKANAILN